MLEVKHLKALQALRQSGSLAAAADILCLSRSALSHQLKDLEHKLGVSLFERKTQPVRFTEHGYVLLELADKTLPIFATAETKLKQTTRAKKLNIGIECHACFQWLLPAISDFRRQYPEYEVDLITKDVFELHDKLAVSDCHLLFTDELQQHPQLSYQRLGRFEMLLVASTDMPLPNTQHIQASDLLPFCLLVYPVVEQKLDVFKHFLLPAAVRPKQVRQVENTQVILQMVAAGLGVSVLPDWLVSRHELQGQMVSKKLGKDGITKSLYAVFEQSTELPVTAFIQFASQAFAQFSALAETGTFPTNV